MPVSSQTIATTVPALLFERVRGRRTRRAASSPAATPPTNTPPAGGFDSNTSIQDAYNLAYVIKGQAGPALLDTYHQERQPIGQQVIDRAMKSIQNMLPLIKALGFQRGQTREEGLAVLQDLFSAGPGGERRRADLAAALDLQD